MIYRTELQRRSVRVQLPRLSLYLIALWNPLQYFFTRHLGVLPDYVKWLDDAAVLFLVVIALFRVLRYRGKSPRLLSLIWFLLFFAFAFISALVNQVPVTVFVAGLRPQLMYIAFFYSLVILDFSEKSLRTFFTISTLMALIQVPVGVIQFIQRGSGVFNPDFVFGTFAQGWANILGHYLLIFIFVFLGLAIRKSKKRLMYIVIVVVLVFGLVLTGARASLFFLAIGSLFVVGKRIFNRYTLRISLVLAICAVVALNFYYSRRPITLQVELHPRQLLSEQMNNITSPGRLYYLIYTWELIQQDGFRFFLGVGPGRYASTAGSALDAPLLLQATRGAYSPFIQSQVVAILGEYGLLGTGLLFGMHINLLWQIRRYGKCLKSTFWGGVYRGFVALSFYYIFLGVWVEKIWETQPMPYYFWFFAASIFLTGRRESIEC